MKYLVSFNVGSRNRFSYDTTYEESSLKLNLVCMLYGKILC